MEAEPAADEERLRRLLTDSGALLEGHFALSSGRHSAAYVQCARLLEDPTRARFTGRALAARLERHAPDSILSPALGGLIIGHEVAAALAVPFRFAERHDGEMVLRRGFELAAGERVAVVDDVVTTGGSTRETLALAAALGARPVGVGAIIDRSEAGRRPFDVPFESLLRLELALYEAATCPLCRAGGRPESPGSRSV